MSAPINFFSYLWKVCLSDKFPVWATLLGIIVGAVATGVGTYLIIPNINQTLEKQRIRSEFVIRNLDDLNNRTRALVSDISELHFSVLQTNRAEAGTIQKILSKIAEMQWKAVELAIIFEGTSGAKSVNSYQAALDEVRGAVVKLSTKDDLAVSQAAIEKFSRRTLDVIRELAELGGLKLPSTAIQK